MALSQLIGRHPTDCWLKSSEPPLSEVLAAIDRDGRGSTDWLDDGSAGEGTTPRVSNGRVLACSPFSLKSQRFYLDRKGSLDHFGLQQLVVHAVYSFLKALTEYMEPRLTPTTRSNGELEPPDLIAIISQIDVRNDGPKIVRSTQKFFAKTIVQLSLQRCIEVPMSIFCASAL